MSKPTRTRVPRPVTALAAAWLAATGALGACSQPAPPGADAAPPAASAPAASAPATSAPAASTPTTPSNEPMAPPLPAAACDAGKAQWAVGNALDEVLLERARVDAGAAAVRSLKPGQMVTMEINAERLNVDVDADGNVTGVRCG